MTMVGFVHNLTGIDLKDTVTETTDTKEKFNNYKVANRFHF